MQDPSVVKQVGFPRVEPREVFFPCPRSSNWSSREDHRYRTRSGEVAWLNVKINGDGINGKRLGIFVLVWVNVEGNTRGSAMGAWSESSGVYVGGLVGDAVELSSGGTEEVSPARA